MASEQLVLTKGFWTSSLGLGVVFGAIVLVIGKINKPLAEIATVPLALIYHAYVHRFEHFKLHWHRDPDITDSDITVELPKANLWHMCLMVAVFFGVQMIFGFYFGVILGLLGQIGPDFESTLNAIVRYVYVLVGLTALADFVGGYLVGKTVPSVQLVYVPLAVFLSFAMVTIPAVRGFTAGMLVISILACCFYIVCALLGVKLGHRRRRTSARDLVASTA